jgi:hypothetical protein
MVYFPRQYAPRDRGKDSVVHVCKYLNVTCAFVDVYYEAHDGLFLCVTAMRAERRVARDIVSRATHFFFLSELLILLYG